MRKVAIIGAGIAGLAAAHHLRDKAVVTIFEREDRIGGRVFSSKDPPGEHGAEFLLKSENAFHDLISELNIKPAPLVSARPGYLFRDKFASGCPAEAGAKILSPKSSGRIAKLFRLVRREQWPKTSMKFDRWLSSFLAGDQDAIRFVKMLLVGDTCAPPHHLSTWYSLECLWSLLKDDWYRIEGGSAKLVKALAQQSKANIRLGTSVNGVDHVRGGVRVLWSLNGDHKSDNFQAAIITTPNGECLLGKPERGHFHGYVSVLFQNRVRPMLKAAPSFDLTNGLYTDGPLNYLQLTEHPGPSYVLRILIPNAAGNLFRKDPSVVAFCAKHLQPIIINADQFCHSIVKSWKFGLPCGGDTRHFQKVGSHVYLAGDRFGKWPSMDTAVRSGKMAADALLDSL